MKKLVVCIALTLTLSLTSAARAAERAGDAALGAISGAVVLGPIGAVAGAVVGYTAGPHISRSWGLRRSGGRVERRVARQDASAPASDPNQSVPRNRTGAPPQARAPAPRNSAYAGPPVQGFD
jgi:hypothetical protein